MANVQTRAIFIRSYAVPVCALGNIQVTSSAFEIMARTVTQRRQNEPAQPDAGIFGIAASATQLICEVGNVILRVLVRKLWLPFWQRCTFHYTFDATPLSAPQGSLAIEIVCRLQANRRFNDPCRYRSLF